MAVPLTNLTRKECPEVVVWTEECDKAFNALKNVLTSTPVHNSPDFEKTFILQTDASNYGVGTVLSLTDAEGLDHPVAYFSHKLLDREQKYSTIEKECLAIKLAVKAFQMYLLGQPFIIQTDHQTLQWLSNVKDENSHLARWSLPCNLTKLKSNTEREGRMQMQILSLRSSTQDECCAQEQRLMLLHIIAI